MCYLYYVFNFFLIDSGKGKLCACLCQDGGMHKKACDKTRASIRSSTTTAILLKSVVSACQDPSMAMSSKRTFILLIYFITSNRGCARFFHCSLAIPHSLFDTFHPGLTTFGAFSARCVSAFAAALRRPILAPDFVSYFISRSDSVPTLFVYIRWGFRPSQFRPLGARWAWVFLARACGTTSKLAAADRSCWFLLNRNFF